MVDHEDELPPALRGPVRALRTPPPPPSDVWRYRLLRSVESATAPTSLRPWWARRWSLRPFEAVAAGLVCAVVGAAVALAVARYGSATGQRVAVAPVGSEISRVRFTLVAPGAASVSIVGDFNGWNPTALPMRRSTDGTWQLDVPLSPGRYAYAFVVDGALARDPSAPQTRDDDFGSPNSILMVSGS